MTCSGRLVMFVEQTEEYLDAVRASLEGVRSQSMTASS